MKTLTHTYSRHALLRMEERGITPDQVELVVSRPRRIRQSQNEMGPVTILEGDLIRVLIGGETIVTVTRGSVR